MRGRQVGHCRRIDHAQPFDPTHAQLRIEHAIGLQPHRAAAGRMQRGDRSRAYPVIDPGVRRYRPPGLEPFRLLCQRAKRVYWLNPEPRSAWDTLDSTMSAYAATCTKVFEVRNLRQLGEAISEIV